MILKLLLAAMATAQTDNIVQLAQATPTLSTLVSALTAGDLVTTLEGAGPFTVFAPTNAAFTALPAGVLTSLLEAANKPALVSILQYHVVSGKFLAAQLTNAAFTALPAGVL